MGLDSLACRSHGFVVKLLKYYTEIDFGLIMIKILLFSMFLANGVKSGL